MRPASLILHPPCPRNSPCSVIQPEAHGLLCSGHSGFAQYAGNKSLRQMKAWEAVVEVWDKLPLNPVDGSGLQIPTGIGRLARRLYTFLYRFNGLRLYRCPHVGKDKSLLRKTHHSGKSYHVACRQNAGDGGDYGEGLRVERTQQSMQ